MTTDEKKTAAELDRADKFEVQSLYHQQRALTAEIEATLYKVGPAGGPTLGQQRDALAKAMNDLGERLTDEYGAREGRIDAATGVITRPPQPEAPPAPKLASVPLPAAGA